MSMHSSYSHPLYLGYDGVIPSFLPSNLFNGIKRVFGIGHSESISSMEGANITNQSLSLDTTYRIYVCLTLSCRLTHHEVPINGPQPPVQGHEVTPEREQLGPPAWPWPS